MFGDATLSGYVLPFSLTRTRDAEIVEPARSAPIGMELEGTWNAVVDENGMSRRVVLTMANQGDGTATARLINIDEGELEIPLSIAQTANSVTLTSSVIVSFAFSGALNADGTELTGSFTQGPLVVPATFRRVAKH